MTRFLAVAGLSLWRLWRGRWAVVLPLAILFLLSVTLGVTLSAVYGLIEQSRRGGDGLRLRTLKVTAPEVLTRDHQAELSRLPGVRAVPSVSTVVYARSGEGSRGGFRPVAATSRVAPDDPTLAEVPVLEGDLAAPGVVVAPNLLQRLGYPTRGVAGRAVELRAVFVDPDRHEHWCAFRARVAAVVGDLGYEGLRLDLPLAAAVLRYQRRGDPAAIPGASAVDPDAPKTAGSPSTPASTDPPAATADNIATDVFGPDEPIHSIRLVVDDPARIPALSRKLEATGRYRCESAYYSEGRQAAFVRLVGVWGSVGGGVMVALVGLTIAVFVSDHVHRETALICAWRASGARGYEVVAMYVVQWFLLSLAAAALGAWVAHLVVTGPGQELAGLLQVEHLFGRPAVLEVIVPVPLFATLSALGPALRARTLDLQSGLYETGGVMG